jgi:hypothetical protein
MGWMIVVLGLALALVGGCSSGMGSSMTGPSSRTTTQGTGSDTGGGRSTSANGDNQMM